MDQSFDIQHFMRTEGIPFLLNRAKARRAAMRADAEPQTVVRIDADDFVSKAARRAERRIALQGVGVRTDEERQEVLERLDHARAVTWRWRLQQPP